MTLVMGKIPGNIWKLELESMMHLLLISTMVYQQTYTLSNFGAHVSRLPHVHIFFCCSNFDVLISFGAREITKWQLLKIIKIRVCNALFAFA